MLLGATSTLAASLKFEIFGIYIQKNKGKWQYWVVRGAITPPPPQILAESGAKNVPLENLVFLIG